MLASHAALCGLTGRFAMGVFQTLSAGNMGQSGAPGTGVPADADTGRHADGEAQPEHRGRQERDRSRRPASSHECPLPRDRIRPAGRGTATDRVRRDEGDQRRGGRPR